MSQKYSNSEVNELQVRYCKFKQILSSNRKKYVISSFVLNNAIWYIFYTYIYTQYTTVIYSVYSIQLYYYTFSFNFAKYDEKIFI